VLSPQPGCRLACDEAGIDEACTWYGVHAVEESPVARSRYLCHGCNASTRDANACVALADLIATGRLAAPEDPGELLAPLCAENSCTGCGALANFIQSGRLRVSQDWSARTLAPWCNGLCGWAAGDKRAVCAQWVSGHGTSEHSQ
jgi:hypothetical protein